MEIRMNAEIQELKAIIKNQGIGVKAMDNGSKR